MVQVIDDEFNGNVFGRLGKGIGKGLSEQIPKEIERGRLASGLKQFEKESNGLTPVQQFTRLAAIPGVTAEHLYSLTPLLRQQQARDEAKNRAGGAKGTPQQPGGGIPQQRGPGAIGDVAQSNQAPFAEAEGIAGESRSLKPLSATQAQLTPITRKSPDELFSEAALLSQENPSTYPTPSDAMQFVASNEDARIANLEEQRRVGDVADTIEARLKTNLENYWGKELTDKDIPGTVQTRLARNIADDLANPKNKLSEQQLITKWGEVGKRLAKAQTNLDSRSRQGWLSFEYTPEKISTTIDNVRKVYEDAGALEEFQDIIANKFNLSSGTSAYLAYPPKNGSINKYIKGIKPPIVSEKGTFYPGTDPTTTSIQAADNMSQMMDDKDSILSYATQLKLKGLDPKIFFDRMNQNVQAGLFDPTARQREELQKGLPTVPSLGDIYLFTLRNQDKLVQ